VASLSGKRIAVGGFMHETNTFQPKKTTYADFAEAGDRPPLVRGAEVLTRFDGMNQSIAGALEVLRPTGATLLPLLWTSTTPGGYVTEDAFERITEMLLEDLRAALPVDAIYLNLHGAMSDAMVAYCTYPHIDMADTGVKAGRVLAEILARGRKPAKAYRQLPYLIPLTWQCSTLEPSKSIYALGDRLIRWGTCTPGRRRDPHFKVTPAYGEAA
jgi:microcystin degradation protein MlrC